MRAGDFVLLPGGAPHVVRSGPKAKIVPFDEWLAEEQVEPELLEERLRTLTDGMMDEKIARSDPAIWRIVEKDVLLRQLDHHWKEHLATLDALRQVIWMRGIAQKQPINEYKQEAFALFETMLDTLREEVTKILFRAELRFEQPAPQALPDLPDFLTGHIDPLTGLDNSADGDGSELRPELFGSLAGSPRAATGPGGASTNNPYANLEISRNAPSRSRYASASSAAAGSTSCSRKGARRSPPRPRS